MPAQGVLPAVRGPFITQETEEGRALDESVGGDGAAQAVHDRVSVGGPRSPERRDVYYLVGRKPKMMNEYAMPGTVSSRQLNGPIVK